MKKIYAAIAGLFLFANVAHAEVTWDSLPSAGTLDGTEGVMVFESGVPKKSTTGNISSDVALPPLLSDAFDCIVDTGGTGDYTTINAAWTGGCRFMYVLNGTYTMNAATTLSETDPSTRFGIVGESNGGVTININGNDPMFRLSDGAKVATGATDEIFNFTNGLQTVTVSGSAPTIQTWGVVAGDFVCPKERDAAEGCYIITEVTNETTFVMDIGWLGATGTNAVEDTASFYDAYKDIVIRDVTFSNSAVGDDLLLSFEDAGNSDRALSYNAHIHNVDFGTNVELASNGRLHSAVITDANSTDCCMYMGAGTLVVGGRHNDESGSEPYTRIGAVGVFGVPAGTIAVGNRISDGGDFTSGSNVAIGNMSLSTARGAGTFVEQVWDSLYVPGNTKVNYMNFNNSNWDDATQPTYVEGLVFWDSEHQTLAMKNDISGVTLEIGQEQYLRAVNGEVDTLNDGETVYICGVSGNRPKVCRTDADAESTSYVIGMVTANITTGQEGWVTTYGIVHGFDTSTVAAGAPMYLQSTAGTIDDTKPASPKHGAYVGTTLNSTNNGSIFIHPSAGSEITELHDVDDSMTPATEAAVLMWSTSQGEWTASDDATYTRHLQIPATEVGNPAQIPDKDDIDGIVGCYAFDGGVSVEELHLQFEVPDDWDGGDIIFEIDTAPMVAMIDTETYTFDITYRAVAEGEPLTQGTAATRTSSYTSSGATAQYYFTHPQATIDFDDANQPLTKQDHIFIVIDRDNADSYASDVCVTAFEIIYQSTGLPRI